MTTQVNTTLTTVVEVDIESWLHRPAVTSRGEMYLIDGKKVIGKVRLVSARGLGSSGLYETVSITPGDENTKAYFKEYENIWIADTLFLKFDGVFGYIHSSQDLDDYLMEKFEKLRIVDQREFDFGICHPFFSDVEGFDNYHKAQNKLRIHTKQKSRKPRDSRKIKKVKSFN
jgi:hypothetical protein